jgi:hypothetical protein
MRLTGVVWNTDAKAFLHKGKTEQAYRRGDMFDRRRRLMADWAEFCAAGQRKTAKWWVCAQAGQSGHNEAAYPVIVAVDGHPSVGTCSRPRTEGSPCGA